MAVADCSGRRRFAVACGVLSSCVRAEAAATAGKVAVAGAAHARPATMAASSTMLLMPGAEVAPDVREEEPEATTPSQAPAQITVMYGGRVLVFDDVPAHRAAELVRVAARQDVPGGMTDVPLARKASLQRFMEKRRNRLCAKAPYATARPSAAASNKGQEEGDTSCWLRLGLSLPGGLGALMRPASSSHLAVAGVESWTGFNKSIDVYRK